MLKKNEFGWYYLVCDYCGATFGMDDLQVRTNREETLRQARMVQWKIGKENVYCYAHRNKESRRTPPAAVTESHDLHEYLRKNTTLENCDLCGENLRR